MLKNASIVNNFEEICYKIIQDALKINNFVEICYKMLQKNPLEQDPEFPAFSRIEKKIQSPQKLFLNPLIF